MIKEVIIASMFAVSPVMAGPYIDIGKHPREGGWNAAVGYQVPKVMGNIGFGGEVEYMDFGEQSHTVTRNRVLNINAVASMPLSPDVNGFLKAGISASKFSDPYNDFDWDKSFKGWMVGTGMNISILKDTFVQLYITNVHYQQCSQDKMNDYQYGGIGVRYEF